MSRSVGRSKRHRSFMDRLRGRTPLVREDFAEDLRDRGEDVWKSLRF